MYSQYVGVLKWKPWISAENDDGIYEQSDSPFIARPISFYQKDQISFKPFSFNPDTRFGDKGILKFSFLKLKPIKCWLSLSSQTWSLLMFTLVPNPSLGQCTIPFEPLRLLFDSETSARPVFWSGPNKMYGDIHMSTIFNTSIVEYMEEIFWVQKKGFVRGRKRCQG